MQCNIWTRSLRLQMTNRRCVLATNEQTARPCIQLNVGFRKMLMALERKLRPNEPPSIKLKLASRKPVLSSSRRPSKSKDAPGAAAVASAGEQDTS
jgi:hypothetical protein